MVTETRSHRPFGVEIESYLIPSQASIPRESIQHWQETTDGSIHPDEIEEEVTEIVEWRSPPFVGDAGLEALRRDVQKIRDMGFRTNRTCGVHVHCDVSDTTKEERQALLRFGVWIENDIYSFVAPSRREVPYARPLSESGGSGNARYKWLNAEPSFERHKTVELRLFSGTTTPDVVVESVKLSLRIVERGLRLGMLAEKPQGDVFKLLGLTKFEKDYWSETIERFARRPR
ncbi:MAG: amidoligase family protein [Elusimicrobiota bacterium]|nr:amidoligase family protein [Elusimicrobiota bacterium]